MNHIAGKPFVPFENFRKADGITPDSPDKVSYGKFVDPEYHDPWDCVAGPHYTSEGITRFELR
jgi:hypothetical protein